MGDRRLLAWPGSYNVRDLGDLPTHDGRATRFGSIVRSESPSFFAAEAWPLAEAHGIRTCVDLRSGWEVEAGPYQPPAPIARASMPLEEGLLADVEFHAMAEDGRLGSALYYATFLHRWPDRAASVLRAVGAAPKGAVLVHCERGRDRTGLVALLLLHLAGVPDEVIVEDHLATDDLLLRRGIDLGHVPLDGEAELYAERRTTPEATLLTVLGDLDVPALLRAAGASTEEVEQLRSRLAS